MTYAIDTNVLVYASVAESEFHDRAVKAIERLYEQDEIVYLFWPVVMGYLRVVTSPIPFREPITLERACQAVERLLSLPNVRSGTESGDFWRHFSELKDQLPIRGKLVPDAHIVALMRQHGVNRILTHDRDFRKFDGVRVIDPFD